MNRRHFLRAASGLLLPASGLLLPRIARAAPIVINGPVRHAAAGGGGGTITFVQGNGTLTDNAVAGTRAFGSNVTSGNKIVVCAFRYDPSADDPFIAGDCTKSAGTATIGAVALLATENINAAGSWQSAGMWAADVTGSGSLTVSVAGNAGNYWGVAGIEINSGSGWDGSYLEDTVINLATEGNAVSGDATSAGKAIFIGVVQVTKSAVVTITPDAAFNQVFEEEDDATHTAGSVIYKIVAAGDTDSFDWTLDTPLGWVCAGAVIKGA